VGLAAKTAILRSSRALVMAVQPVVCRGNGRISQEIALLQRLQLRYNDLACLS
jgi:hypothetical protein